MFTKARGSRNRPRPEQTASRVVMTTAALAAVVAVGWMVDPWQALVGWATAPAAVPAERYAGAIQLAPDERGLCEQFVLNNKTGTVTPSGAARCTSSGSSASTVTGSLGRLNTISAYFRPR